MKNYIVPLLVFTFGLQIYAQEFPADSLDNIDLEEVIIITQVGDKQLKESKILGSLDNYLEKSTAVNMIKRGAYAWEPMLQGMSSERSVVTLDGMRIYSACTDKMDPVTSYVEITNFSKANIVSGSSGSEHGGSIAGSIDLIRRKASFNDSGWGGSVFTGFESVNKQKIIGTDLNYSGSRFFSNLDFTYRDADNYKAGGNEEILYSQFTKYNLSAIAGVKLTDKQSLEASLIYDHATDVGYPALPMDVSTAKAIIGSVQYNYKDLNDYFNFWETKLYYNKITHVMDDSQRPDVPIRMDMPGWSSTYGFYSKLRGDYNKHRFGITLSGHLNNSLAEMTMYPNNPNEAAMYMMTWPDVNTLYGGLFLEDQISLNAHLKLDLSAGIALQHNGIESEFGWQSLQVFYPDLKAEKTRTIKNTSAQLSFHHQQWLFGLGMDYGERAPSVSEAYGFYLFNSYDAYDYVGNPYLDNEKSIGFFLSAQFKAGKFKAKWQGNYFHIYDYIIGKPDGNLLPMTIGANGIKVYEALNFAQIFNTDLDLEYGFLPDWIFSSRVSYRYGEDNESNRLPLMQPLIYRLGLKFNKNKWTAEAEIEGSSKNNRYSAEFGETPKDAYLIANMAFSKKFSLGSQHLNVKIGIENLLDENYTTFSDWNNIPRPGRNLFLNLVYQW